MVLFIFSLFYLTNVITFGENEWTIFGLRNWWRSGKIMSPLKMFPLDSGVWDSLQYTAAAFTLYTAVNKRKCCVFTGILQASHEDEAKRLVETINDKISWGGRPWLWRCCQVNSGSSVSSCTQPCQASLCLESWTSPVSALLLSHYSYFYFFL